jgi:hypothetical protein
MSVTTQYVSVDIRKREKSFRYVCLVVYLLLLPRTFIIAKKATSYPFLPCPFLFRRIGTDGALVSDRALELELEQEPELVGTEHSNIHRNKGNTSSCTTDSRGSEAMGHDCICMAHRDSGARDSGARENGARESMARYSGAHDKERTRDDGSVQHDSAQVNSSDYATLGWVLEPELAPALEPVRARVVGSSRRRLECILHLLLHRCHFPS